MSLPDLPLLFWPTAMIGLIFIGIGKAGFGGGVGLIAIPIMALTIPVAQAAALLLPLLIIMDLFSIRYYAQSFDQRTIKILLPGAIVGIVVGGYFFHQFSDNERTMELTLGLIALIFVGFQATRSMIIGALTGYRMPDPLGLFIGVVAGFTSTVVHAGGPPANLYILPQQLPRRVYVGTTVVLWTIVNLIKLIPYAILGLLKIGDLSTILLLAPFCYLGVRLGLWANGRVSEVAFTRVVYSLLFLTGLELVIGKSLLGVLWG